MYLKYSQMIKARMGPRECLMRKRVSLFTLFVWSLVLVVMAGAGVYLYGSLIPAPGDGEFASAETGTHEPNGTNQAGGTAQSVAAGGQPQARYTMTEQDEAIHSDSLGDVFLFSEGARADVDTLDWNANPSSFSLKGNKDGRADFASLLPYCAVRKITLEDGNEYDRFLLPGGGHPEEPGLPNITGYQTMIRIPKGARVALEMDEILWASLDRDVTLDPLQRPIPDVALLNGERPDENMPFVKNHEAYAKDAFSERGPVELVNTVSVRGKTFAVVAYRPLDFNPAGKAVRLATRVNWHLSITPLEGTAPDEQRDAADPGGEILASDIDLRTEDQVVSESRSVDVSADINEQVTAENADYLIITEAAYSGAVAPLAEWKRKKGYRVFVATMAEVGATDDDVKTYIQEAYAGGNARTSFVLLVGDHEDVPSFEVEGHPYHGSDHLWHTDYEYACVDGNDRYADVTIGRLPGDTAAEVTVMVNKILTYETNPPLNDRYNHMLVAGQFQDSNNGGNLTADRMFMEDLHRISDFLGPDYDFFSGEGDAYNKGYAIHTALQWDADRDEELRYGGWRYGSGRLTPPNPVPLVWKNMGAGDRADISAAINDGVSLVVHRDHGYGSGAGWADPHYTATEVNGLTNGTMTPVVFSLNCATGWFDGKDSFAESWVNNEKGGAVGFTGAARVSYSGYNDLFHVGLMDTFWSDYDTTWDSDLYPASWKPASALNRAKHRVFAYYGTGDRTAFLTARFFNWLGDPDMELRTRRPASLTVTHPETISAGTLETFDVTVQKNGTPLAHARVAIVMDKAVGSETHVVFTGADGIASFSFTPQDTATFTVTVTEHDAIPYEGLMAAGAGSNLPPIADAGPDQAVVEGSGVTLTGAASRDRDGSLSAYLWEQQGGTRVTLSDPNSSRPSFVAPDVRGDEALTFTLTVTDNEGLVASDACVVNVKDISLAPVADAGRDVSVYENSQVVLNGSASHDDDGQIVSYRWDHVSGPAVVFADASLIKPTFTAPMVDDPYQVITLRLTVTDNTGLTGSALCRVYVYSNSNQPPVANAGSDHTVYERTRVELDGSGSNDTDGTIRSYRWSQVSGPSVVLSNAGAAQAAFTAPDVSALESVVMRLTVTDDDGATASDTCSVDILNKKRAPQANAGDDVRVWERRQVTLDGSRSSDPDGWLVAYRWEQMAGPAVTLSSTSVLRPTFIAPDTGMEGETLVFRLTVTDNEGGSARDECFVTVDWVNDSPIADAGPDQTASRGDRVILNAGGSSDSDDGIASYRWEQLSGSGVTLYGSETSTPWFRAGSVDTDGQAVEFRVTVTDRHGLSDTDRCIVNLLNRNFPPVADAGPDVTVSAGENVTLDGSNSSDSDGAVATWAWDQIKGPKVVLAGNTMRTLSFAVPDSGTGGGPLEFELTVTDSGGLAATDTVLVNITTGGMPPSADAGPDQRVEAGASVVLNGANSSDPDGGITSFRWKQVQGQPVALLETTSVKPVFTAELSGDDTVFLSFELTVTDKDGLSSSDICHVNVSPAGMSPVPPVADAGASQSVSKGAFVTVDGSRSSDPDGGTLTYLWKQTSGPSVTLSDPTAVSPGFTVGSLSSFSDTCIGFALTVTNECGLSANAVTLVNVVEESTAPVADAGADLAVEEGVTVTLDASGSTDARLFLWEQVDGSGVTLSNPTSAKPTFVAPYIDSEMTVRKFTVTVQNSFGLKSRDEVTVTILDNRIDDTPGSLSFRNTRGEQVRIQSDAGDDITKLYPISDQDLAGDENRPDAFGSDLLDFEVKMVTPEDKTAVVWVNLPEAAPEGYSWYKFSRKNSRWVNFDRSLISGGTGDGAVISADRRTVTLYLTDNGIYDDDDAVGLVRDPGGMAKASVQGSASPSPAGGGSGGGGGCAMNRHGNDGVFDPTLILLLSLSFAATVWRRRKRRQAKG